MCLLFFLLGHLHGLFRPAEIEGGYLRQDGWFFTKIKTPEWFPYRLYRTARVDDFWIMYKAEQYMCGDE